MQRSKTRNRPSLGRSALFPVPILEGPVLRMLARKESPDYKKLLDLAVDSFGLNPSGQGSEFLLRKARAFASLMGESHTPAISSAAERLRGYDESRAAGTIAFLEEKAGIRRTDEAPKPKLTEAEQETLNSQFLDAAATGKVEEAKRFLEQGAKIDARDSAGRTALIWAARENHIDMVKYLGSRTDVNAVDKGESTALMYASMNNHSDVVEELLDLKADPRMVNRNGDNAASLASRAGHIKVFNILKSYETGDKEKRHVVDLDAYRQIDRDRRFLSAVKNNEVHLAQNLLNDGADIDARHENCMNALMYALMRRHTEASLFLVENNSDPNAKDSFDITVLMHAMDNQMPRIADTLMRKGADKTAADHHRRTCLMRAAYWGYDGFIDRMIDDGAEVDARDISQGTALMDAVNNNQLWAAERLLERGADPNAQNDKGMTPLMWAREENHDEMIKLLKRYGAIEKKKKGKPRRWLKKYLLGLAIAVALGLGIGNYINHRWDLRFAETTVTALSKKRDLNMNDVRKNTDHLIKALESENKSIRVKAFWMLALFPKLKQNIPDLEKLAPGFIYVFEDIAKEHDDHTLRDACWVIRDLAVRIKDKRIMEPAVPLLKQVLSTKKEGCAQQAAATALVAIGKEAAVNAFIDVLRDGNKHAQVIAISRLGSIGGERAAKALDLYRRNPPDKLWGIYAEEVYKKITQKNPKQ